MVGVPLALLSAVNDTVALTAQPQGERNPFSLGIGARVTPPPCWTCPRYTTTRGA